MMKKILNNLMIITLLLSINKVNAQVGFLGKKNSIDIDIANPAFGGIYTSYKYTFSKRTSFYATLGFIKRHADTLKATPYINDYVPAADFKGFKGGVGLLWNFDNAGMNMPLGYYLGFSIDFIKGTLVNTIPKYRIIIDSYHGYNYYNNVTLNYTFKVNSINYNFHVGKNIYLLKNICFDVSINAGFNYSKYIATNHTEPPKTYSYKGYAIYNKESNQYFSKSEGFNTMVNLYPKKFYSSVDIQGSHLTQNTLYRNSANKVIKTLRPIIMPQIKIAYLF